MKKAGKKQIRSLSTKTDVASVEEYKKHVFALKIFFYRLIILIKLLSHNCFEAHRVIKPCNI